MGEYKTPVARLWVACKQKAWHWASLALGASKIRKTRPWNKSFLPSCYKIVSDLLPQHGARRWFQPLKLVLAAIDGILPIVFKAEKVSSLYVHVPFCAHKCEYCAFFSEASSGELMNRYVNAFVREMELVAEDLAPHTIFFGGGTPSILNLRQWESILRAMERLKLLGAREWTVESNPATVSLDKAKLWRDFGVNRVSMGVQSLDESLLERLGRIHSRQQVFKSFDTFRAAGFDNLHIDLMFAIPTQTMDTWRATLKETLALGSEHLSCYEVIYEEDTPLFAQLNAGEFDVNEDLACAMYDELVSTASAHGFEQYEIANFARPCPASLSPQRGEGLRVRGEQTERAKSKLAHGYNHPSSLNPFPVYGRRGQQGTAQKSPHPVVPSRACSHNRSEENTPELQ